MSKALESTIPQISLAKMSQGLAKPIATVRYEPMDFSQKLGISFESTKDDLDELDVAIVRTISGRRFALARHRHQPKSGTDILTDESSSDIARDLKEVSQLLRISRDDLSWVHPEIERSDAQIQTQAGGFLKKFIPQRIGPATPFGPLHVGKDILSSDVEIIGSIRFQKELLIDGKVEGEIHSDGVLTVGEHGDIRGEIKTKSLVLFGKVQGNIIVAERCELKSKCTLQGDLKAARLIIEEGATFIGKSEVTSGMSVIAATPLGSGRPEVVRHEEANKALARA